LLLSSLMNARLRGITKCMVLDRDTKFLSHFSSLCGARWVVISSLVQCANPKWMGNPKQLMGL